MSQLKIGDIITLPADGAIPAYRIVGVDTSGQATMPATITSSVIGATNNNASATGEAIGVIINGTCKVACSASITAGDIIAAQTGGTGLAAVGTTTAAILGVALASGSTNSVIEITVQPRAL